MNYYELLEVSPKASDAVIRAAYKSLMQRYHPDKNGGSPEAAERATLVVRAYEVLSDLDKRSAYDLDLQRQASLRQPYRASAKIPGRKRAGWLPGLALGAAILLGWGAVALVKAPRPGPTETAPKQFKPLSMSDGAGIGTSTSIPSFITRLDVTLTAPKGNAETSRVLSIPAIDIRVGGKDPELAARHINNIFGQISEKLEKNLAEAEYEELLKPDGERYLTQRILGTISETTGTASQGEQELPHPPDRDRYGIVEVTLPRSYSVR